MKLNPYQVAVTDKPGIPLRRWRHLGTIWSVSHREAAYQANVIGNIIEEGTVHDGASFTFPNATVRVSF